MHARINHGVARSEWTSRAPGSLTSIAPDPHKLGDRLREVFVLGTPRAIKLHIRRRQPIYTCGDKERTIYYVESGSIKISSQSASGKECILEIHTSGDLFGEFALLGSRARIETATARERSVVWRMSAEQFVDELRRRMLLEDLVTFLIERAAEQRRYITYLTTETSRQRLGQTLLFLANKFGKKLVDSSLIDLRLSQEELSEMIGTTRPRVSVFLCDFRRLGLISTTSKRQLIVRENRLKRHLEECRRGC